MNTHSEMGSSRSANTNEAVHCWDLKSRKMVCGAPGQIGSTKHVRDVTCSTCLEILGRPSRPLLSAVPH